MYGSGTGYLRVGTSSNQNLLNQDGVNNDEWMEVEYETDIRNGDQVNLFNKNNFTQRKSHL